GADAGEILQRLLAQPDVASKDEVIRRYDHEVQGGTAIKPLVGPGDGPGDAAVLVPLDAVSSASGLGAPPLPLEEEGARVRGHSTNARARALAVGCGIAPRYGELDPYAMAVAAVDEAVRNVVAVGA